MLAFPDCFAARNATGCMRFKALRHMIFIEPMIASGNERTYDFRVNGGGRILPKE
jgi:hypothetical protein